MPVRVPAVTSQDEAELEKFIRFLQLREEGRRDRDAYAEIYGQVLYDVELKVPKNVRNL